MNGKVVINSFCYTEEQREPQSITELFLWHSVVLCGPLCNKKRVKN